MNEITPMQSVFSSLEKREDKFVSLNSTSLNTLNFEQELLFARQLLTTNDYLMKTVMGNQQSLVDAIYNVASLGISLNPANAHAYLVPRKVGGVYKVCLDVSYRGFLKIATDSGCVKYMKAEMVYENDEFEYHGFDQRPTIKTNPFKGRGGLIGVYAMAVLHDDSVLVEMMSVDEVNDIRNDSEAYKGALKKGGYVLENNVWVKHYGEMVKKTVLKRACKTLPQSRGKELLEQAAFINNEHEGINFNHDQKPAEVDFTIEQSDAYRLALANGDYTGLLSVIGELTNEGQTQLWDIHEKPLIPAKGKGRYTQQMADHLKDARVKRDENVSQLIEAIESGDDISVQEMLMECNKYECDFYIQKLNGEQASFVNSINLDLAV